MSGIAGYRKRTKVEIEASMIETIINNKGPIIVTKIMYRANLSHPQLKIYLVDMIGRGLLEREEKKIRVTPNGAKFYEAFKKSQDIMRGW